MTISSLPGDVKRWLSDANEGYTKLPGVTITRIYDAGQHGVVTIRRLVEFAWDNPGGVTTYSVDDMWADVIMAVSSTVIGQEINKHYCWQTTRYDGIYAVVDIHVKNRKG